MSEISYYIELARQTKVTDKIKQLAIACMDYTTLSDDDDEASVTQLCQSAKEATVAAVCIYPPFVTLAKSILKDSGIAVATVTNFPAGNDALSDVLALTEQALADGADEIDLVIPYQIYQTGDQKAAVEYVSASKALCGDRVLKVILETGALSREIIADMSRDCIAAGADFLKTSTGKIAQGASLEAAANMLLAIREVNPNVGCKVSGGIRTAQSAAEYIGLASAIMGEDWVTPAHFRIGASSLLVNLG